MGTLCTKEFEDAVAGIVIPVDPIEINEDGTIKKKDQKRMNDLCNKASKIINNYNGRNEKKYTAQDMIDAAQAARDEENEICCMYVIPERVIFNDPATIIYWANGDRTVVKCAEGQEFNDYFGFCAAVAKRLYVSNSQVMHYVKNGFDQKFAEHKKAVEKLTKEEAKAKKIAEEKKTVKNVASEKKETTVNVVTKVPAKTTRVRKSVKTK